jgi:hypothetical protein
VPLIPDFYVIWFYMPVLCLDGQFSGIVYFSKIGLGAALDFVMLYRSAFIMNAGIHYQPDTLRNIHLPFHIYRIIY